MFHLDNGNTCLLYALHINAYGTWIVRNLCDVLLYYLCCHMDPTL